MSKADERLAALRAGFGRLWNRLAGRGRGAAAMDIEREIDDELTFHLEMRTRENLAAGMPPAEARRRAAERLGELDAVRRQARAIRSPGRVMSTVARLVDDLRRDLGFAARGMLREPGLAATAVLALTLGIGTSTAAFSIVNDVLLDAVPYASADRLVSLSGRSIYAPQAMPAFRDDLGTLASITFFHLDSSELVGPGGARAVRPVMVDEAFLSVVGVQPVLGRAFSADDSAADAPDVVLLCDALWRASFGADSDPVGATLTIGGAPHTVIGVMPPGFDVLNYRTDLLVPMRDQQPSGAIGRLRPGATFEEGRSEAEGLAATFDLPEGRLPPLYYRTAYENYVPGVIRRDVLLLTGAVSLVMLIACANVANLLLARSFRRSAEISVRTALGAGRGRLMRQLVAESGLLAFCGGLLGVVAAVWVLPAVLASSGNLGDFTDGNRVVDPRVLGFTLLLSVVSSVLAGLAPALATRGADLRASMRGTTGPGSDSPGGRRLLNTLVVAEVALALVLLVGAGLLLRTFLELRPTDPGFDPDHKLTFMLRLPERRYPDPSSRSRFVERVLAELSALPGVDAGAANSSLPLGGVTFPASAVVQDEKAGGPEPQTLWLEHVSRNYHEVMDITILRGRGLQETSSDLPEIVLSEVAVGHLFPQGGALGRRLRLTIGDTERDYVVVGVAANIREHATPYPSPLAWVRFQEILGDYNYMSFVVGTRGRPEDLAAPVRELIAKLDVELPVQSLKTMDARISDAMSGPRFHMSLIAAFGGMAILLAAIGFYGVMAYAVSRRTRELGVRVALGASARSIQWMVVRQGAAITAIGVGLGLVGCLALTRAVESFLYGVSVTDPLTYGVLVTAVAVIGFAACYIPARRATRIDPITALRTE